MKSRINYILLFFLVLTVNGLKAQEPACNVNCQEGQAINIDLTSFIGTLPNSFVEVQWWTTEDKQLGTQVTPPFVVTEPGDYYAFYYDPINDCYNQDVSTAFIRINGCSVINLWKSGQYVDTNNDGLVNIGDVVEYSFTVSNNGNLTVSDITVSDDMVTVNGGPISLAPGQTDNTTFTATYAITQADIDAGGVWNLAIANGNDPYNVPVDPVDSEDPNGPLDPNDPNYDPNCPTCTFTGLDQDPSIAITKNGTYDANTGVITYSFEVTNTGNTSLTNILIDDAIIGVTGLAVTPSTLQPGQTGNATVTYTVTQADIDAGGVWNIATVTGEDPNGDDVAATSTDPNPLDPTDPNVDPGCTDCTFTELDQDPSIAITKNGTYDANTGVITYSFEVTNTGNTSLTNILIDDAIIGVTGLAVTPSTLQPGQTGNATITYTVTQADIDAGGVWNIATVTGEDPNGDDVAATSTNPNPLGPTDPNYDPTCPDCTFTELEQEPSISITKSGSVVDANNDGVIGLGDNINYTFEVTNTGNTSLTNILIDDAIIGVTNLAVTPSTLHPGQTGNATITYTVTQADLDAGGVWNIATVTGEDPNGDDVTATSTDPNPLDPTDPNVDPGCTDCTYTPLDPSEIIANNDNYGPIDGTIGGTTTETVFDNDTLNGNLIDPNDVTITVGEAEDTNGDPISQGGIVINPNGTITVDPFTPSGTYTVEYTICEDANPNNCDTATVTVIVDSCFAGDQPVQLKCD